MGSVIYLSGVAWPSTRLQESARVQPRSAGPEWSGAGSQLLGSGPSRPHCPGTWGAWGGSEAGVVDAVTCTAASPSMGTAFSLLAVGAVSVFFRCFTLFREVPPGVFYSFYSSKFGAFSSIISSHEFLSPGSVLCCFGVPVTAM